MSHKPKLNYFVVDYDLPIKSLSQAEIRQFYRKLRKLFHEQGEPLRSSSSVIVTDNEGLAWSVWNLAKDYRGRANIYRAKILRSTSD